MSNPLINYINKDGLHFFYRQIKALIDKSGMNVVDITTNPSIPQLTKTGSIVYFIKGTTETLTKGLTCDKLPTGVSTGDLFILNNCYINTDNSAVNTYVLFDEVSIFVAKATTSASADVVLGTWTELSDPTGYLQEMTEEEYEGLISVNPDVIYFVKESEESETGKIMKNGIPFGAGASADDLMITCTQAEYDALPESKNTDGKIYFITDAVNGANNVIVGCTQEEYDAIPESVKESDGKLYMISDSTSDIIHMPDIINTMKHRGEIYLYQLPVSGMNVGDFYYVLDRLEGRYWDGTGWKRVK